MKWCSVWSAPWWAAPYCLIRTWVRPHVSPTQKAAVVVVKVMTSCRLTSSLKGLTQAPIESWLYKRRCGGGVASVFSAACSCSQHCESGGAPGPEAPHTQWGPSNCWYRDVGKEEPPGAAAPSAALRTGEFLFLLDCWCWTGKFICLPPLCLSSPLLCSDVSGGRDVSSVPKVGPSLQKPFSQYLEAQRNKLHHAGGSAPAVGSFLLIVSFIISQLCWLFFFRITAAFCELIEWNFFFNKLGFSPTFQAFDVSFRTKESFSLWNGATGNCLLL